MYLCVSKSFERVKEHQKICCLTSQVLKLQERDGGLLNSQELKVMCYKSFEVMWNMSRQKWRYRYTCNQDDSNYGQILVKKKLTWAFGLGELKKHIEDAVLNNFTT